MLHLYNTSPYLAALWPCSSSSELEQQKTQKKQNKTCRRLTTPLSLQTTEQRTNAATSNQGARGTENNSRSTPTKHIPGMVVDATSEKTCDENATEAPYQNLQRKNQAQVPHRPAYTKLRTVRHLPVATKLREVPQNLVSHEAPRGCVNADLNTSSPYI